MTSTDGFAERVRTTNRAIDERIAELVRRRGLESRPVVTRQATPEELEALRARAARHRPASQQR